MTDRDDDALMTVAPLLDQIAEVFSDVTPGAVTIHEAELLDGYSFSEEERQAARMQDKESRRSSRYRSDAPATLMTAEPRR